MTLNTHIAPTQRYYLPANRGGVAKRLPIRKTLVVLFTVFALILPAQLALNSPWQIVFNVGVAVFTVGGLLLPVRVPLQRYGALPICILILMMFCAGITAFLNEWARPVLVYGGIVLAYFAAMRSVEFVKNPAAYIKVLVLGTCFTSLAIIAACFAAEAPTTMRYKGFFEKPNSMGWFCSSISSLLLGVFVYSRTSWRRWQTILMVSMLALSLLLLFMTNARAGLAGICAAVGVFGLVFLHSFVMQSRARRQRLFFGLAFVGLVTIVAYYFGFLDRIFEKFQNTSSKGDLSQGRFFVWSIHLEHWQWFGNGSKYITLYISHNTYIDHLTKYGMIPLGILLSFMAMLWTSAYYYTIKGTLQAAPILLSVITTFMVHAIFETGTSTPGLWLAIVLYCCLLNEVRMSKRSS